ncbi:MAG: DUF1566 domain-containing protein [Nitrospirota bacterium]
MRSQSRSPRMWGVTVAGLCVLWFVNPAGAIPLESWDGKIPNANQRFKVLPEFNNEAVLDKETGLVWEQTARDDHYHWGDAQLVCTQQTTGGRKAWRLPSVHELASLLDPSVSQPLGLPLGHPFTIPNLGVSQFWSATSYAAAPDFAWEVTIGTTSVGTAGKQNNIRRAWCVRGGQNHGDAY